MKPLHPGTRSSSSCAPLASLTSFPSFLLCSVLAAQEAGRAGAEDDALTKAIREIEEAKPEPPPAAQAAPSSDLFSTQVGAARVRFIDLSLDALFAAGTSTEDDESLQSLQGGGHDPRKRGFTVQNVELSFLGAVDPYFTGEAHIIYFIDPIEGESIFELEEAFLRTQSLPWGLQVEAGQFFTEFGRLNPQHPHQWDWQDQPVINTRLFGPDGLRNAGFRLGWLTPLPWFSEIHAGMQNANGETAGSFLANDEFVEERPIEGRPFVDRSVQTLGDLLYLLRWDNGVDITDEIGSKFGLSGVYGPNYTGEDGETVIYGADIYLKWRRLANDKGWPFVVFQAEVMRRHFHADSATDEGDPLDPTDDVFFEKETLQDWGTYVQLLYGFERPWAAGIRYDFAKAENGTGRRDDPFRDERHRISPLIVYHPSEFSRLRLQYNYDHANHLPANEAHSVWLGVEFLFGAHAAHTY